MELINPNFDWYSAKSFQKNLHPRCPYANLDRCPHYYECLSLLGEAQFTTPLQASEEKRLLKKWKKSKLLPTVREHEAVIWNDKGFHNFCPEIAFDVFELFASELHRYADEIDSNVAHEKLGRQDASSADWRWQWSQITPLHYSECRLYSLLLSHDPESSDKTNKDIIEIKPSFAGVVVDVKEIVKRTWKRLFFF